MLVEQIHNLRVRIRIIQHMQTLGVLSLIMCIVSMAFLFSDRQLGGQITFGLSLLLMLASLLLTLLEIQKSGVALDLHLQDVERGGKKSQGLPN
ncbi:MAG: family cellulose-binding protein [Verrucomicrobiaceae bacterium]|nr:family cellulose-binding protein [Verrucomicrobiaceae bacterium]